MTVPKIWRKIPEFYNLQGTICPKCNAQFFPPREVCTECGEHNLEKHYFEGKGKIVTFTVIRTPISDPEGENIDVPAREIPYVLALVKLNQGPILTTQIVDCDIEGIGIGMDVSLVFRKIQEKGKKGVIQYGYKFRPSP